MKRKFLAVFTIILILASNPLLVSCGKDEPGTLPTTPSQNQVTTSTSRPVTTGGVKANTSMTIKDPGQENVVTLNGKASAIIPANTLPAGTKIEISEIKQAPSYDFDGFIPYGFFEITSSTGSSLGSEVTLEFFYGSSGLVEELEIPQQLAVAYYNEEYGAWQEVDFAVNENKSTLAVKTTHFSLWTLLGFDSKWVTSTLPGFTIYFNKNVDAPPIGSVASGEPIYEYASIVRTGLFDASKAYREMGFKMPEHSKVYIDKWDGDKEAEWGWFSKNIEIPLSYFEEQELRKTAAHELFHAVQNQYVTFATMAANRWFMEATADYAAAHVATSYGLSDKLPYNYLQTSIASSSTFHMYQSAHFIKYLADNGFNFKELFVSVMEGSGSALENLNKYLISKGSSLPEMYENFAYDVIFTNRINTPAPEPNVYRGIASPRSEFSMIGGAKNQLVKVGGDYAATLYGVYLKGAPNISEIGRARTTHYISVSAIEPTSGVKVLYVLADGPDKFDVTQGGALSNMPEEIAVKGDGYIYFLVTNVAPSDGYVTIAIDNQRVKTYSNERSSVLFYNDEFKLDVSLNLSASQPFIVSITEDTRPETLYLNIYFEETDKNIVIDAEVLIDNLIPVGGERPDYEYMIKRKYWDDEGEMETAKEIILSKDKREAYLEYNVIVGLFDKELGRFTTQEHPGKFVVIRAYIIS